MAGAGAGWLAAFCSGRAAPNHEPPNRSMILERLEPGSRGDKGFGAGPLSWAAALPTAMAITNSTAGIQAFHIFVPLVLTMADGGSDHEKSITIIVALIADRNVGAGLIARPGRLSSRLVARPARLGFLGGRFLEELGVDLGRLRVVADKRNSVAEEPLLSLE